ncbi:glycosyl transferase [Chitinophaga alhagiae]|uniref:Glycosyl transferase n=1 Tax=Chitinophaga alhagiae TaxID=2203219 RepID=A0ABM6WB89_9BACT|nr:glycosyltransferase [Chitinophaga alhagiae]AWO01229.1 glycosyl transferase [Chitinophaga alhagiae]
MNALLIITLGLAFLYGILMLSYSYGWRRLKTFDPSAHAYTFNTRVSVIIPARDEEQNLPPLLEALQHQSYPANLFEVIVVDDFSEDGTADIVKYFPAANIRLIRMSDHISKTQRLNSYKKKAIELAIGQAEGHLIVTTDADCVMGPKWLETIVKFYETYHPRFIAAPVAYHREDGFFKKLQSLDFMTMQGITGSVAYLQTGTMCNGANLAYEKTAFEEVGGFTGIDMIASGDDMLLMYKIYHAYPDGVMYLKSREAVVRTLPVDTVGGFMQQRIRWSSKADKYEDKRVTRVLVLVYIWNVILVLLALVAVFNPALWSWWLGVLVYKVVIELIFLAPVASFFRKARMLAWFIPGQPFHIIYVVAAGWLGKFGSYEWKGRQVK